MSAGDYGAREFAGEAEGIDQYRGVEDVIAQRQLSGVATDPKARGSGSLGEHGSRQVDGDDLVELVGEQRGDLSRAGSDFKASSADRYLAAVEGIVHGIEAVRALLGVPCGGHAVEHAGGGSRDVGCPDAVDGDRPGEGLQLGNVV
jgi:hypothetical protein